MQVLQVMGCTSDQYASMERYLVAKAQRLRNGGSLLYVTYENRPRDTSFMRELLDAGGILLQDRLQGLGDASYYSRIRKQLRAHKIDLVHLYFTPTCHALSFVLRTMGFRNIVRTAANMPFGGETRPPWKMRFRNRLLAFPVKKVICRSEGVRDAFLKLGVPARKLAVADGGCDTGLYRFSVEARQEMRTRLGIQESDLALGACCRLVPSKRVDRLIYRLGEAVAQGFPVFLVIAGDGPERRRLEALARQLNVDKRVLFTGHVDEELRDLYSALDIFCLPSETEGMSNSLLEAMATERPILASDIPSNRCLVEPERGGYLLSFDSQKEFFDVLERLYDQKVREPMGIFNRRCVDSRFSIDVRISKEMDVYREVLEKEDDYSVFSKSVKVHDGRVAGKGGQ